MLEVHVPVAGRDFIFAATHMDYHKSDAERLACVTELRGLAAQWADTPFLVAGDLNATPDGDVLRGLYGFLLDSCPSDLKALTFPADKPDRRIDYILYSRNPRLRCREYRVVPEPVASDHCPILAVFEVRG